MNPSTDQHPDSQPFDGRLRDAYDFLGAPPDTVPPPPDHLWAGVEAALRPVPAPRWRTRLRLPATGLAGVVLGVLLMWTQQPATVPAQAVATTPVSAMLDASQSSSGTVPARLHTSRSSSSTVPARLHTSRSSSSTVPARLDASQSSSGTGSAGLQPVPGRSITLAPFSGPVSGAGAVAVPTVLTALVLTETTFAAVPADSARPFRERRRAALLAQRAELARLRWRTDSLLLGLGEAPPSALAATDSLLPSHPPTLKPSNPWSLALAFAPERNFFGLQTTATDTQNALRRTHETGRAGYNAALLAEYRVNPHLSVGAGLGLASYGAELRLTDRRTTVTVAYDTAVTHTSQTTQSDYKTYSIRIVREPVLSPLFNTNFQIIGYDTVYVPRPDTVWTHVILGSTNQTTTTTTTPTVTTRQEVSARILRPNYRFATVPVLVRYRLGRDGGTPQNPWWADVALGAQVQFFLGGTQLASSDGVTWRTEHVGPTGGPFRPLTVALTGALALNYALTPRLSASVAPTLRYQTESVYKASTGLTQRPAAAGVQLGLRVAF